MKATIYPLQVWLRTKHVGRWITVGYDLVEGVYFEEGWVLHSAKKHPSKLLAFADKGKIEVVNREQWEQE